jgi:hypothetical protein
MSLVENMTQSAKGLIFIYVLSPNKENYHNYHKKKFKENYKAPCFDNSFSQNKLLYT